MQALGEEGMASFSLWLHFVLLHDGVVAVRVSQSCRNKVPQAAWFKTMEIYSRNSGG